MKRKARGFLWVVGLSLAAGLCIAGGPASTGNPAMDAQDSGSDERLDRILRLTKAYCARLDKAALDFVCFEDIKEEFSPLPELGPDAILLGYGTQGMSFSYRTPKRGFARTFVYDYQFIRKAGQSVENRTLIEEDGRAKKEPNAQLQTLSVRVQNALFGPVGLLSADRQSRHDYTIAGEETAGGKKVLLVDAVRRPPLDLEHVVGRLWILEKDASILKIEWSQTSVGNFELIQDIARKLKAEPQLVSTTEYGIEKNGIRFPSRDTTEEAYILKDNKRVVRSKTTIVYRDYKFFTVETEVDFRR
ncbi:MAG: hypothetical protein OEW05_01100 [Candidatus Aminicenantes bacterium]|nr:hypothetical protein [Candidatus Aminicenantes bacterium]